MVTETMDYQGMVAEFMRASGQEVNTVPTEMTTELAQLRYNLFIEEVQELKDAIEANDRVEQLDALVDITYILCGTANSIGRPLNDAIRVHYSIGESIWGEKETIEELLNQGAEEIYTATMCIGSLKARLGFSKVTFDEAFRRAHVSNMSKFYLSEEDCYIDQCELRQIDGIETYIRKNGDFYVLYRATDGKVLKGNRYNPVDLTDLV